MGSRFEAVDGLLDDSLTLPVPGRDGTVREYRIASPSSEDGLWIERLTGIGMRAARTGQAPDTELLDDDAERNLYQRLLGDTYEAMLADGVTWAWLKHAAKTVLIWCNTSLVDAERFWVAAGDPSRLAPPQNRADRRSSAAASSTKRRGSTSGTSSRKATARSPKPSGV